MIGGNHHGIHPFFSSLCVVRGSLSTLATYNRLVFRSFISLSCKITQSTGYDGSLLTANRGQNRTQSLELDTLALKTTTQSQ